MNSFLYAINIGTLATWLSVAGFGTFGIVVPTNFEIPNHSEKSKTPSTNIKSIVLTENFILGDFPSSHETNSGRTGMTDGIKVPVAALEALPTPPEMPEIAEITPLPEIPEIPAPTVKSAATPDVAPIKPQPAPSSKSKPKRSVMPASPASSSSQAITEAKGTAGNGGRNGNSGMSDAKRLAGGRMPAPSYPVEARAKGQTGTVLVEFVVGENGSVVSASVKSPSPWPMLNECAVSAIRRWKFQPGGIAKYTRPIVFKLN